MAPAGPRKRLRPFLGLHPPAALQTPRAADERAVPLSRALSSSLLHKVGFAGVSLFVRWASPFSLLDEEGALPSLSHPLRQPPLRGGRRSASSPTGSRINLLAQPASSSPQPRRRSTITSRHSSTPIPSTIRFTSTARPVTTIRTASFSQAFHTLISTNSPNVTSSTITMLSPKASTIPTTLTSRY